MLVVLVVGLLMEMLAGLVVATALVVLVLL